MNNISIKLNEDGCRYCDYCNNNKEKFVHKDEGDRDICFDCVLVIYGFVKNEVLN